MGEGASLKLPDVGEGHTLNHEVGGGGGGSGGIVGFEASGPIDQ